MKKIRITAFALLSLVFQGCASMMSHGFVPADSVDPQKGKCTPVYPGVVADVGLLGVSLASPFMPDDGTHSPPWFILMSPLIVLDIPLSLVADTIFLPSDLLSISEWRASKRGRPVRGLDSGRIDQIEQEMLKEHERRANNPQDGTSQ